MQLCSSAALTATATSDHQNRCCWLRLQLLSSCPPALAAATTDAPRWKAAARFGQLILLVLIFSCCWLSSAAVSMAAASAASA